MSDPAAPKPLLAVCPHCHKTYSVRPEHVGRTTRCRQCSNEFVVKPGAPAGEPAGTATAGAARPGKAVKSAAGGPELLCPVCQCPLGAGEATRPCPACHTVHHADCWEYNRGCGLYGCKECPETEKLRDIEIPASYWGQTEKNCPRCNQIIQGAAVRCRHCGATFESAKPLEISEFAAREQQKKSQVTLRRTGIALLIFAVLPCTAPFAAVIGGIWYLVVRRQVAQLHPMHATICRLAVGIALGVTALMIIVAAIYSASGAGK